MDHFTLLLQEHDKYLKFIYCFKNEVLQIEKLLFAKNHSFLLKFSVMVKFYFFIICLVNFSFYSM